MISTPIKIQGGDGSGGVAANRSATPPRGGNGRFAPSDDAGAAASETTPPRLKTGATAAGLGAIDTRLIYTLEAFLAASGLESWSFKQARKAGLRQHKVGRRVYVSGKHWAEFLDTLSDK